MKRILIGLGVVVAGVGVALGLRSEGAERPAAEPTAAGVEMAVERGTPPAELPLAEGVAPTRQGAAQATAADTAPTSRAPATESAAESDAEVASGAVAAPADGVTPSGPAASVDAAGSTSAASSVGGTGVASAEPANAASAAGEQVDAETVLRRASEAYDAVKSLQADFTQVARNPLLGTRVTSRGTLYQRRPDRFLMKFSEPAGDVIVSDGRYIWVYYPSVDEDQVMRAPAGAAGAGGVDLQAQFLGDPVARFRSELLGKEEVGGRPAYVVTMVPREPMGYRSLKVWVDASDYLVRRFEIVEDSGLARHLELSDLELNMALSDSLFRFTPPPGARIVER